MNHSKTQPEIRKGLLMEVLVNACVNSSAAAMVDAYVPRREFMRKHERKTLDGIFQNREGHDLFLSDCLSCLSSSLNLMHVHDIKTVGQLMQFKDQCFQTLPQVLERVMNINGEYAAKVMKDLCLGKLVNIIERNGELERTKQIPLFLDSNQMVSKENAMECVTHAIHLGYTNVFWERTGLIGNFCEPTMVRLLLLAVADLFNGGRISEEALMSAEPLTYSTILQAACTDYEERRIVKHSLATTYYMLKREKIFPCDIMKENVENDAYMSQVLNNMRKRIHQQMKGMRHGKR